MNNERLVVVERLTKFYAKTCAVEELSFELRRGEILGLLGANGAGKTTTLHMVMGLLTPTSGTLSVLGQSPYRDRHRLSMRINFSSAYGSMPLNLKVEENLTLFTRLYQVKEARRRIAELLELFEISHLRNRLVGALSSGEKTKLNLIKSLINNPELLILDEPTSSLDPAMAEKVRRLLKDIHRRSPMGILYTSHNMLEVEELCDRVIFMHHGRKIAEGTSAEIQRMFASPSLEQAFIRMVRGGDIVTEEKP